MPVSATAMSGVDRIHLLRTIFLAWIAQRRADAIPRHHRMSVVRHCGFTSELPPLGGVGNEVISLSAFTHPGMEPRLGP